MALYIIGEQDKGVRVGNGDVSVQIYSDLTFKYIEITQVNVTYVPFELSTDSLTLTFKSDPNLEGNQEVDIQTTQGTYKINVYYQTSYEKQPENNYNSVKEYYPKDMFDFTDFTNDDGERENWKLAETNAIDTVTESIIPPTNIPLQDSLAPNFGSYVSSQFVGILMQMAIKNYDNGNPNFIVMYTNKLAPPTLSNPNPYSINNFIRTVPVTNTVGEITTDSTDFLPSNIFSDNVEVANAFYGENDTDVYGVSFVAYPDTFSPEKYKLLQAVDDFTGNDTTYKLRYGAIREGNLLKFCGIGKTIFFAQASASATQPPANIDLEGWEDVAGTPATVEVIYNTEILDIFTQGQPFYFVDEMVIPAYNRFLEATPDFISWVNTLNGDVEAMGMLYNGKEFLVKLNRSNPDPYFRFSDNPSLNPTPDVGSENGFDNSIFL